MYRNRLERPFSRRCFLLAICIKGNSTTVNISIVQSYSWARNYEYCDSSTVANQNLIGSNTTKLQCTSGCTNSVTVSWSITSFINLLVTDADNDYIQYRHIVHILNIADGMCQAITGSQLLPNCSLIFTPTTSGPYVDQSCVGMKVGVPFAITITAQIGCARTDITDFNTVSPIEMLKSSSIVSVSSTTYSVSFSWTPTLEQMGTQIFCVAAIRTYIIQSSQL
ncbi:unnamed protein product [Adineta ricciae]|uniref:Uncharacterized protein n=1 Tax=Adineta ricciae TaxID=249248 RepID=A0A813VN14_ADIRI|nr:unnamed protein product [Adineta ricciae]